jgi:thymidylate synthase (FAD)
MSVRVRQAPRPEENGTFASHTSPEKRPKVLLVASTRADIRADNAPWSEWACDATTDADMLAEFAGRLCYQSWNKPNPATARNTDYIANILLQQHYSVLEHAGFTVAILGVSRSFTHELVRHRHLSFSQLSQRFVDKSQAAFVPPPLFRDDPEATALLEAHHKASLAIYRRLVAIAEAKLAAVPGLDKTARRKRAREAARCVLPNMTETQIVVTGNHRAWREFLEKRATEHADAEMREVALQIYHIARSIAPATYQDFREEHLPDGTTVLRKLR